MKLVSISVKNVGGELGNNWSIINVSFDQRINLFVGQNATGKSRMINIIQDITNTIKNGKYEFELIEEIEIAFIFKKENNDIFSYEFKIKLQPMDISVFEKISINNNVLLDRKPNNTLIYSFSNQNRIKIDPPEDRLVLHIRRDKLEFPFLEDLVYWANKISIFSFSDLNTSYFNRPEYDPSWLIAKLNSKSIENVVIGLNKLGYSIERIEWHELRDRPGNVILVKEKGIEKLISEYNLSQGLFRALGLLIYVENLIQNNSITTIIIDDLGEGLDYERATKLGKLLVEKLENSNIQFIATTNDSFLMDVIPIKYWNILHREGNVVKSFNYQNSKELFDNFAFTGLSNFDLFSSDYLFQKT